MKLEVSRTAYMLLIHKNPNQANQFIKQLIAEKNTDVYVHLDKKNHELLSKQIISHPNIIIIKESIDVKWGDISLVDATILLLKAVKASGKTYDFVCLRSGQDLLVKNGFKKFLLSNKNKIFMSSYYVDSRESHAAFVNVSWPEWARELYINPFHPYRLLRRVIAGVYQLGWNLLPNKKSLPREYKIYNGSNWFCIPFEVADYALEFLNDNHWYYESFKNSLVPDVFFFQTLIMNSKYKSAVVNNNLMYIAFGETLKTRNNPITLKMEHIGIINKSNLFFARKFDENIDNHVIEYFSNQASM